MQPAVVKNIYETFVQILMEIKPEDFRQVSQRSWHEIDQELPTWFFFYLLSTSQPQFEAISFLEYPELHQESFSNLVFLYAL